MSQPTSDKSLPFCGWRWMREVNHLRWKILISIIIVTVSLVMAVILCGFTSLVKGEPITSCDASQSQVYEVADSCPWHLVISDVAHRLRLLEMAFKEQVIAREVIAAEVSNQSYYNLELEKRLEELVTSIRQLYVQLDSMREQVNQLSSRLYSDECLGFLILMFVILQLVLAIRTKIRDRQVQGQGFKGHKTSVPTIQRSLSCNSLHNLPSPRQNVTFKQEMCVVTFSKAGSHGSLQTEMLLAQITEGMEQLLMQSFVVDSPEALKDCPRAKLYLVFADCQCSSAGQDNDGNRCAKCDSIDQSAKVEHRLDLDLEMTSLRMLSLSGGHLLLLLTNECGSQQLPDQALYNPCLQLLQSDNTMQDLAVNGRIISIWKELSAQQLNHVKKISRSIFNMKGK